MPTPMHSEFQQIVCQMEPLLKKLLESPLLTKDEIGNNPKQGVYVFYDEEEKPIYVGRSNNIRQRIRQHGADSSMNESATFAFELLQEDQMDEPDIPGRRSSGVTKLKPR